MPVLSTYRRLTSGLAISALVGAGLFAVAGPASAVPTYAATTIATVGQQPDGIGVDSTTHTAYVANTYDAGRTVSVLDLLTNEVTATVPVGGTPWGVGVDASTGTAYVSDLSNNRVSVIDGATRTVTATIPVAYFPLGVAVDPTTHTVYVASNGDNSVSAIDGTTNTVIGTVRVGAEPFGIAVDPSTHTAYVTNRGDNTVSVIDGTTLTVTAVVPVGTNPVSVGVDSSTHTAYVANGDDGTISVIDGATNAVTATVGVSAYPYGVAVDSVSHEVYVTGYISREISVIDGTTHDVASVSVNGYPYAIAVDQSAHRGYTSLESNNAVAMISRVRTAQAVAFTSTPPSSPAFGATYSPTATGGSSGLPVTFRIDPATSRFGAANAACTIAGTAVSFDHAGSCVIDADQAGSIDFSPAPTAAQTVIISQVPQAVTFTAPTPASGSSTAAGVVGGSDTVTAVGGGSAAPVVLSVDPASSAICTVSGSVVAYTAVGTCTLDADQAGTTDYTSGSGSLSITVARAATAVSVAVPTSSTYGQSVAATATVSATDSGPPAGAVRFNVDGAPVGAAVTVSAGSATSGPLTGAGGARLTPGAHLVGAVFTPADATTHAASTATARPVIVAKASSRTQVAVTRTAWTATVTPGVPGAGTPTGRVRFLLDGRTAATVSLVGGVATLAHHPTSTGRVSAVYTGDNFFTMSTAPSTSTTRSDPTITARISSANAKTSFGWYRSPVTVTFTCDGRGGTLARPCPVPVTLKANGGARTVSRSVATTDGGVASVTSKVNIDHTAPTVRLSGVGRRGGYVASAPHARCAGRDSLSGLASCRITHRSQRVRNGRQITYTATATDRAGNRRTTHRRVRIATFGLIDAPYRHGAYTVHRAHEYTASAISDKRPRYIDAAPYPQRPTGVDNWFHRAGRVGGHPRWLLTITITTTLRHHRYWNIGVMTGHTLRTIKLRVLA